MIIKNCIKCKFCGDIIISEHRHDFKCCSCGRVAIDGGHDYLKRSFTNDSNDYEELSIIQESSNNQSDNDMIIIKKHV